MSASALRDWDPARDGRGPHRKEANDETSKSDGGEENKDSWKDPTEIDPSLLSRLSDAERIIREAEELEIPFPVARALANRRESGEELSDVLARVRGSPTSDLLRVAVSDSPRSSVVRDAIERKRNHESDKKRKHEVRDRFG